MVILENEKVVVTRSFDQNKACPMRTVCSKKSKAIRKKEIPRSKIDFMDVLR